MLERSRIDDSFSAFARLDTQSGPLGIYHLAALRLLNSNLGRLPFSIRGSELSRTRSAGPSVSSSPSGGHRPPSAYPRTICDGSGVLPARRA